MSPTKLNFLKQTFCVFILRCISRNTHIVCVLSYANEVNARVSRYENTIRLRFRIIYVVIDLHHSYTHDNFNRVIPHEHHECRIRRICVSYTNIVCYIFDNILCST